MKIKLTLQYLLDKGYKQSPDGVFLDRGLHLSKHPESWRLEVQDLFGHCYLVWTPIEIKYVHEFEFLLSLIIEE